MKLVLVSQEYPPETARGGIGSQTFQKAHTLAALGHSVIVVSASPDSQRHEYADEAVRVIRIPCVEGFAVNTEAARWLTYSTLVAAELKTLQSHDGIDLIDFPEWGGEGFVYLLNRTQWDRVRIVVHLHGPVVMLAHTIGWPDPQSDMFRIGALMEELSIRRADAVMSSSRCSARWCAEHYQLDLNATPILHAGIDCELFSPQQIAKEARPTILCVGRVTGNKGAHTLVQAACRVARRIPSLRLRFIGAVEPRFESELRGLAQKSGCNDMLEFLTHTDRRKLPDHFSRAHIFVGPSRYEGGPGFVFLEAMACGLAAVGCTDSGIAETITHGKTGMLVPPDDADALAQVMQSLLADHSLRDALGREARRYAVAEADSRLCARRIASFYEAVVGATGGQDPAWRD
jgi:glycosyltransferase involved in cell wall biosynthesis